MSVEKVIICFEFAIHILYKEGKKKQKSKLFQFWKGYERILHMLDTTFAYKYTLWIV